MSCRRHERDDGAGWKPSLTCPSITWCAQYLDAPSYLPMRRFSRRPESKRPLHYQNGRLQGIGNRNLWSSTNSLPCQPLLGGVAIGIKREWIIIFAILWKQQASFDKHSSETVKPHSLHIARGPFRYPWSKVIPKVGFVIPYKCDRRHMCNLCQKALRL